MNNNLKCPECGCEDIGEGILKDYTRLLPKDKIFSGGSFIIAYVCTNCGYIIKFKAERPHIFKN